MIDWFINLLREDREFGAERSSKWATFRKRYEKIETKMCAVCKDERVELHHIIPFHQDPSKELDKTNVIWLCDGRGTLEHHRGLGHLGSFRSWNPQIREDADILCAKITGRP